MEVALGTAKADAEAGAVLGVAALLVETVAPLLAVLSEGPFRTSVGTSWAL